MVVNFERIASETEEDKHTNENFHECIQICINRSNILINYTTQQIVDNYILFALSVAIIISLSYSYPGESAGKIIINELKIIEFCCNVIVFLISGMTLRIEDLKTIWEKKYIIIYGILMINIITTFVAFITRALPFSTREFAIGMTIFVSVPTTLGVGVALTQLSKGDVVASLFLTVVSNILGILTIPLLLQLYLSSSSVSISPENLAYRLTLSTLIPTIVGIILRKYIPVIAGFTKTYKQQLSMTSITALMVIVWISLSSARNIIIQQSVVEIIIVFIANIIIHASFLLINIIVLRKVLRNYVQLPQAISVIIMASQKSSPVAISVIVIIASSASQKGLLTIPCILGQLGQILVGTFITRKFAAMVVKDEKDRLDHIQAPDHDVDGHDVVDDIHVHLSDDNHVVIEMNDLSTEDDHHVDDANITSTDYDTLSIVGDVPNCNSVVMI